MNILMCNVLKQITDLKNIKLKQHQLHNHKANITINPKLKHIDKQAFKI